MNIYYFKPPTTQSNFGDSLGPWLWDKLLHKDGAKLAPDALFCGVGTMLNGIVPEGKKVIVFGAGAGYGPPPKDVSNWHIYFVRGPKTAKTLGISPAKAITDPGILVASILGGKNSSQYIYGFMPRWDSASERLMEECYAAGIYYIDPTRHVETVISEIRKTQVLITEALHGAVVADALRIPWIPVIAEPGHSYKWYDWCLSMGMHYIPEDLEVDTLSWIARGIDPFLSPQAVHDYDLEAVLKQVAAINTDIVLRSGPFAEV